MKILKIDRKKNSFFVVAENIDDLWVLSTIVEPDDFASALSERKIKLGNTDDRKAKIIKKKVLMTIQVEKVQFHKYTSNLRISGKITQGQDEISAGSYHTLDIEPGLKLSISKKNLFNYQIDKLEEHSKKKDKIIIVTLDRENAKFYDLMSFGVEKIGEITGNVQKKDLLENKGTDFFLEVVNFLDNQIKNTNYDKIIIACPQFWHKYISEKLKLNTVVNKKATLVCANSVGENGIKEVLNSTELTKILKNIKNSKDLILVNELLKNIKTNQKATYGLKETLQAINIGNVKELLITQKFIKEKREQGNFEKINEMMNLTEQINGKINIIESNSEPGKILDGLGGIACISRY